MSQQAFEPGSIAPVTGLFELHHAFGFPTGVAEECVAGKALPSGPQGWLWLLVEHRRGQRAPNQCRDEHFHRHHPDNPNEEANFVAPAQAPDGAPA